MMMTLIADVYKEATEWYATDADDYDDADYDDDDAYDDDYDDAY